VEETLLESPTSDAGPRQKYIPKRVLLAQLTGAAGAGGVAAFVVKTPDSRVRTKVTIVPSNPSVDLSAAGLKIWIGGVEFDASGPDGAEFVVTNAIPGVTRAAPQNFPQDAGLAGYSREFVTSIDALLVELTVPTFAGLGALVRTFAADPSDVPEPDFWALANAAFTDADVGRILVPTLDAPNAAWNVPFVLQSAIENSPTHFRASPDPAGIGVFDSPAGGSFSIFEAGPVCSIYAQARYQPEGQRLPFSEWDEVRKETGIRVKRKIVR
jgi:hypothetical protein